MLEFLFTFAVILFAGFSLTLGVLVGKRPPARSCHCKPQVGPEESLSKCESCGDGCG